jgi:hypothetical protein
MKINPMRITFIAFLMTLATQAGADTKKYGKKECNEMSGTIDFLLSTTPNLWSKLEKNPADEETALELSWTVDLAANYTTIYEAFCTSEE